MNCQHPLSDEDRELFAPIYLAELPLDSAQYVGCEAVLQITPAGGVIHAYAPQEIELSVLDPRWSELTLQVGWSDAFRAVKDEGGHRIDRLIGLERLSFLKRDSITQIIDLSDVLELEALTCQDSLSPAYRQPFHEIVFKDINLDSFLDLSIKVKCGKACSDAVFLYDASLNRFIFNRDLVSTDLLVCNCDDGWIQSVGISTSGNEYETEFVIFNEGNPSNRIQVRSVHMTPGCHSCPGHLIISDQRFSTDTVFGGQWGKPPGYTLLTHENKRYLLVEHQFSQGGHRMSTYDLFSLENDHFMHQLFTQTFYSYGEFMEAYIDNYVVGYTSTSEISYHFDNSGFVFSIDSVVTEFDEREELERDNLVRDRVQKTLRINLDL